MDKKPMRQAQTSLNAYLKKRRRRRFIIIITALCFFTLIVALIFYALRDKASFFRIPSEVTQADKASHRQLRLGGYVEEGSVKHSGGTNISFAVTDFHARQQVRFNGVLPDLFREGQGVIAEGQFDAQGMFIAERVLAKHDEKYVPKDVSDQIKKAEGKEGKTNAEAAAANKSRGS